LLVKLLDLALLPKLLLILPVHSLNDWRIDYGPWITIELTRIASLAIRDRDICASFVRAISAKPNFSCASLSPCGFREPMRVLDLT
ncbi:hypothetical protein Tco_0287725, partial [Tanacetum coccineum]